MRTKNEIRDTSERRKLSVRRKIKNIKDRPRLCVFRSNKYIFILFRILHSPIK